MPTHQFLLLFFLSSFSFLSVFCLSAVSSRSVLGAFPLHELLPEERVLAILGETVALEDLLEVVASSRVLLDGLSGLFITSLHLLDELLEELSVLLGEVRLLLGLLGIVDPVGAEGASADSGLSEARLC